MSVRSGTQTPASGASGSVGITEGDIVQIKKKIGGKKKMTRKQMKEREDRRRARTCEFLKGLVKLS
jgi:hypothetical protein